MTTSKGDDTRNQTTVDVRTARVSLELGATQLAFLDEDEVPSVHPGEYEIRVGHLAADVRATDDFELVDEKCIVPSSATRFFGETRVE